MRYAHTTLNWNFPGTENFENHWFAAAAGPRLIDFASFVSLRRVKKLPRRLLYFCPLIRNCV